MNTIIEIMQNAITEVSSFLSQGIPKLWWQAPTPGNYEELVLMRGYLQQVLDILNSSHPEEAYHIFDIPKNNGRVRTIHAPLGEAVMRMGDAGKMISLLGVIQAKIGKILTRLPLRHEICAFRNGYDGLGYLRKTLDECRSIYKIDDRTQRNTTTVRSMYKIDIRNFFPSISRENVRETLSLRLGESSKYKLSSEAIEILCTIVCFEGSLTQGPPSSPAIANLVGYDTIDIAILRKMGAQGKSNEPKNWGWLKYMRYVDDIIVLGLDAEVSEELQQIIDITIERKGFTIAEEKRVSLNNAEVYPILGVSLFPNKTFQIPTSADRALAYRIKYHDPEERESVYGQLNYNNYVSTLGRTGVKTQSGLFYSPRVAHVLGKSALQK